ncbi:hypothetical protein Lal_00016054 [Lupinus albus]|uniref:Glutamate receptor n=1 Tax=Lupinus albus TaxID=3870 RepID=A0A6A5MKG4_LUPAL|nr:putative periplasmic binding protein-like I [Lupinus albus]KAF1872948.1 hypothetical protein Lal_00016054 [Lupinus albus]
MNFHYSTSPQALFSFCLLIPFALINGYQAKATNADSKVISIGAIIDINSRIGKEQQVAMDIAAQSYNNTSNSYKLALYFQDLSNDHFKATALAEDMIKKQKVQVIVGMHKWVEATQIAELGSQAQVPIISFAAPSITPQMMPIRWPYLVTLANNGTAYVKCIADIVRAYGWQRVVAIYEDDGYGGDYGILALLSEALQVDGSIIEYRLALPSSSYMSDPRDFIREELLKLIESTQSRVFIVIQSSLDMVIHLFREASQMGLVDRESAWIIPESITNSLEYVNKVDISYMEGALGIKTYYHENNSEYQYFEALFRRTFRDKYPEEDNRNPGFYALQAYDSIKVTAQAVDRMAKGVSSAKNILLSEILSTNYLGLSGEIQFEGMQLLPNPTLRIVNVYGTSYRELDFWTLEQGFTTSLSTEQGSNNTYMNTKSLSGVVIWPGKLVLRVPKGWNLPTKQNPMKIAVPGRTTFSKFVKVDYGENGNPVKYTGFCIEIFEKVLKLLEYDLPFEYTPINGSYPDLVQLVYNKTFEAVVGDITLLAERLQYVDFTVPYAESGLSMVTTQKYEDSALMFLKPFSWQMWVVTGAILTYTMLVVWYLERKQNPEFDGNWKSQMGTALSFTFSSLFFAHREKMYSNFTRLVMGAWLFLVLILNSSYTASLSSMLTVQKLKPNITSIEWLKKNNAKIGCDGDSFVSTYLVNVERFKPENIINISSEDMYPSSFKNNSIAAAFLELPYEKVYVNTYCSRYSGSVPTTRFGGLGFMFQKGSPVVKDVSKAILQLLEQGEIKMLEDKWLNPSGECTNNVMSTNAETLNLGNLWVLYAISGGISTLCLIFAIIYSIKDKTAQNHAQGNDTANDEHPWKRAVRLAKKICSRKHSEVKTQGDVTDCSSRWDSMSTTDTPEHQQTQLPEVIINSSTSPMQITHGDR